MNVEFKKEKDNKVKIKLGERELTVDNEGSNVKINVDGKEFTVNDDKNIKITLDDNEFSVIDEDDYEYQNGNTSDNIIQIGSKTYYWKDMNILQKLLALVFVTFVLVVTALLIIFVIIPIGFIVLVILAIVLAIVMLAIPIWLIKSLLKRR